MATKLWRSAPAAIWRDGFPIGTGRLAAMIGGGVDVERIGLNHEWLWRGQFRDRDSKKQSQHLERVRQLLLDGDYPTGTMEGNKAFSGVEARGVAIRVDPYQPAGDLLFQLSHGPVMFYRRELDLETSVSTVEYEAYGVNWRREHLAHIDEDLLLIRLTCENPFGGWFQLSRIDDPQCKLRNDVQPNLLAMDGQFDGGLAFRVEARMHVTGGTSIVDGDRLIVRDADEILIAIDMGTSADGEKPIDQCASRKLSTTDWDKLLASGVKAYKKYYGGFELKVDAAEPAEPVDERLRLFRKGADDADLTVLHFNFARYLMVASTATAELPPNLQGKWNEDIRPSWDCDYHHDVNLQANYWPAEAGALQFATDSLFDHIERFVPHARKVARDLYDCDGVYFPIQTDPWGRATPESFGWAVWIGAAAWLAQHMWWSYEYSLDLDFLRDRAYPFFKEVAAFYESYLIEDSDGMLQIVPSQSPENNFVGGGTELSVALCVSSTMDVTLAKHLLGCCIRSAELLDVDADKRRQWQEMIDKLPPIKIGRFGQLQEWNEDFEEAKPGHRHYSHLWGLYPGDMIDDETTPELWEAAKVSMQRRNDNAGGESSFTMIWMGCLFARMGDGERAWEFMTKHLRSHTTESLLNLEPPNIFMIDGNLGYAALILEMLLQSYHERLHLLPALPGAWPSGSVTGLRARGGYTVDIAWTTGQLVSAELTSTTDRVCTIIQGDGSYVVTGPDGEAVQLEQAGRCIRFNVSAAGKYVVRPSGE